MSRRFSAVSWLALAATGVLAAMPGAAHATDTTVAAGTTRSTALNMAGADTLNVEATGTFETSGTAVTINGASTTLSIDNAGTIRSTDNRAIRLNDGTVNNSHSLTVTNRETGLIESTGDDAFQISNPLYGGTVVVENSGTIQSSESRAINFNAATGGTITINNRATGLISAAIGADVMRPGENATVNNYGAIQSFADSTDFDGDGIDFQDKAGGAVNNFEGGLIEGSKHGVTGDMGAAVVNEEGATIRGRNGSGINFDTSGSAAPVSIVNHGLISGEAQVESSTDTDGDGVDVDGLVAIENYGTIQAMGARGFKDGVLTDPNISDGISAGGGTINNYAGGVIYSVQRGILIDDSEGGAAFAATTINNEGTITSLSGQAITLTGDWNDTLVNKGVITGDVKMGGGADTATLHAGQSIDGLLDGEAGANTLDLADYGTSTVGALDNFETLKVGIAGNGDHGQLDVTDTATISGGTVEIEAGAGPYQIGTSYTLIDTGGGIVGTGFSDVSSGFLFIDPTLGGGTDSVTVTLDRNDVAFASVAATANQKAVANAIDAGDDTAALYQWMVGAQDADAFAASLDGLDGQVHADVKGALAQQSMQVELAILSRLSRLGGVAAKPAEPASAALSFGEADAKDNAASVVMAADDMGYQAWAQGFGVWTSTDGDGNAAGADTNLGGALVGFDLSREGYVFGLAGGYTWGSVDVDGRGASADIGTGLLALYGGANFDAVRLRGGASFGWSAIDTKRQLGIGDVAERPEASYDATTTNLFAELGYRFGHGGATLEPFAGLGWVNVDADGFTETGAPVGGLQSSGSSFDTTYTTLGLRAAADPFAVGGASLTPRGMIGWRHAFDDVTPEAALAFAGTGAFTVDGAPLARDALLLEAGLDVAINRNVNLGLTYSGAFGDGTTANAVRLVGELKF